MFIFLAQPPPGGIDPAPFAAIATSAQTFMAWALLIIGGSVLALVQRAYVRPENKIVRLFYLAFVPGWLLLSRSIYWGTQVQGVYLAALFVTHPDIHRLKVTVNNNFRDQIADLRFGLLFFALWLVIYLLWWIGSRTTISPD